MDSWIQDLRTKLLHALGVRGGLLHELHASPVTAGHGMSTLPGSDSPAGRSFHVAGNRRIGMGAPMPGWAPTVRFEVSGLHRDLRRALAAGWTERGRENHASIAAFARFSLQLLALGAPAHLVGMACAAQANEVRHAQQCFAIASVFGNRPMGPGTLDLSGAIPEPPEPAAVLVDVLRGGTIGDTLAAARAHATAQDSSLRALRAVLEHIAQDEIRHAVLAWRTARWLLGRWPELQPVAERELSGMPHFSHRAIPTGAEHLGFLTARAEARVIGQAWSQVVEPCARVLLSPQRAVENPAA